MELSYIDHIAIESKNINESVNWYMETFDCDLKYQDDSWALLGFENLALALVTPGQHPPHFAVVDESIGNFKVAQAHRDGVRYVYNTDPDKNVIELINRKT
jgi:catechol 2,3-dioxygenase-like lactoylglutathione lyase family enzyme